MNKKRLAAAALAALAIGGTGCTTLRPPLSHFDGTYQYNQNYVKVYLETDEFDISPPYRLDLELIGDDWTGTKFSPPALLDAWTRCNAWGGTLVEYPQDTGPYIGGRVYCEDVDY